MFSFSRKTLWFQAPKVRSLNFNNPLAATGSKKTGSNKTLWFSAKKVCS
jgi:hypothetical protein